MTFVRIGAVDSHSDDSPLSILGRAEDSSRPIGLRCGTWYEEMDLLATAL
jgi:hypothetical protein